MKRMNCKKKLLSSLCLSSLLLMGLVACSSGEVDSTSSNQSNSSQNTGDSQEDATQFPPVEDYTLLRVGVDLKFPPFSYIDDSGEAAGFEPDLALAFGEYLGVEVEIVNTDFSLLLAELERGGLDILIADMAATEERSQKADFSDPYRYSYTLALVNADFAAENNVTDAMSEGDFFALEADFIGLAGTKGVYYPQSKGVDVAEVTEISTGLVEVSMGMSDVLIASNEVHGFHAADPDNTMVYSGILAQDASNFAVALGNTPLLEKANEFIASLYDEGGVYDEMSVKYDPIIAEFLENPDLGLDYIVVPAN